MCCRQEIHLGVFLVRGMGVECRDQVAERAGWRCPYEALPRIEFSVGGRVVARHPRVALIQTDTPLICRQMGLSRSGSIVADEHASLVTRELAAGLKCRAELCSGAVQADLHIWQGF